MSESNFQLTEQRVDARTYEIRIEGELDLAVAGQLDEAIAAAGAERILIDLGPCEFIDSSGIAVILRADHLARERGGRVLIHSAVDQVRRILFLTGLDATGLIYSDRAEALAQATPGDGPLTTPT
ncbi:MAG TPA: STAS domain-containing protein [Solirubrobacterales bacterium]|nr:STAS domain-containing protein [Solirubrobacterales bacterium]